jgi:hypothetical protein
MWRQWIRGVPCLEWLKAVALGLIEVNPLSSTEFGS